MKESLGNIISSVQAKKIQVLLIGMQLPPNYGIAYTRQFIETYADLAKQYQIALVPFLMKGFATNPELIQADGIHPRAEAQMQMLDNVWPELVIMLGSRKSKK
jgi:acyl-CoA thioesterase-1